MPGYQGRFGQDPGSGSHHFSMARLETVMVCSAVASPLPD
jgi:hypothetical protein